jgi:hypothetical protein
MFKDLLSPEQRRVVEECARKREAIAGCDDKALILLAKYTHQNCTPRWDRFAPTYDATLHHYLVPELLKRLAAATGHPIELATKTVDHGTINEADIPRWWGPEGEEK